VLGSSVASAEEDEEALLWEDEEEVGEEAGRECLGSGTSGEGLAAMVKVALPDPPNEGRMLRQFCELE